MPRYVDAERCRHDIAELAGTLIARRGVEGTDARRRPEGALESMKAQTA